MANKRKRLNPRRRAEKKPAAEGKVQAVYLLPRTSETLHISEVIAKIVGGEAIKISTAADLFKNPNEFPAFKPGGRTTGSGEHVVTRTWFDEANSNKYRRILEEINRNSEEEERFIERRNIMTSISPPDWVKEIVSEAFKRAEHEKGKAKT